MELMEIISLAIKEAMKAKDKERLPVLRSLKSALKNEEIEKKGKLNEEEAQAVLAQQVKSRKQAIELYEQGHRPELAEIERKEIVIIETFLPKPLTTDEMQHEVDETIHELAANSMQDMGKVMKHLKEKLGNRADGKILSNLVRNALKQ
jgi:uncharacterized protein YqeY